MSNTSLLLPEEAAIYNVSRMNTPRAHHYVPQFYLQGFVDPSSDRPLLWVYEKNKPVRRSTPKESAHWRDFYAFEGKDNLKNFELERVLGQLESLVAPLVQGDPPAILAHKAAFATFVAFSHQRVPAARELTRELARQVFSALKGSGARGQLYRDFLNKTAITQAIGPFDEEFYEWVRLADEKKLELTNRQLIALTMSLALAYAEFLFDAGWELYHSPDQMFLTSDNPAYTMRTGNKVKFREGFKVPGAEMLFPVRRNLLLRISPKVTTDRVVAIPPAAARDANKMTMCGARRFLFAAEGSERIRKLFDKLGSQVKVEGVGMVPFC